MKYSVVLNDYKLRLIFKWRKIAGEKRRVVSRGAAEFIC
jgi:hypothetical protein